MVEDDGIVAQNNSNDQEGRSWRIATLLSGQTQNKYEHLRKSLIKEFNMGNKEIPSYYHFTKRRPKCEEHILVPSNVLYDDIITDKYNVVGYEEEFRLYLELDVDEEKVEVRNEKIMSAKISGNYDDYLYHIIKRSEEAGKDLGKNLIFIDSYDGAIHSSNAKNQISIVSYSTQVFSKSTID